MTCSDGCGESLVFTRMLSEQCDVDYGGPALVQAFSRGSLVDTRRDRRLATYHQRYRLWTGRPLLELDITLSDLDPDWVAAAAQANPWEQFLACRWAWPDPNAMLRRTSLLAPHLTDVDRPETPDALDISTRRQRTALLFGGLAHHQRHGPRMLDTLLIAGGETCRAFQLGVALDSENPFQAATEFISPVFAVPTESGPPAIGPTGWFFQVDNPSLAVTRIEYMEQSGEPRSWGLIFHFVETAGRSHRGRLRTFRNPVWARQTDHQGHVIVDLTVDGESVFIDVTPHELVRVEVTLG
jgi:alpha-mannosidase